MRYPSHWLKPLVTGLTGWLILGLEGCEKSKVALATCTWLRARGMSVGCRCGLGRVRG